MGPKLSMSSVCRQSWVMEAKMEPPSTPSASSPFIMEGVDGRPEARTRLRPWQGSLFHCEKKSYYEVWKTLRGGDRLFD